MSVVSNHLVVDGFDKKVIVIVYGNKLCPLKTLIPEWGGDNKEIGV